MVFPKGRLAAVLLTGLLAPSAALAQCQHGSNNGQTGMPPMGQFQGRFMGGITSSMFSMRMQTPPTFLMQSQQMQWFGLQQGQQLHLQQMQLIAMQQQMQQQILVQRQMELIAMQQAQLNLVQQQPPLPPPDLQTPSSRLSLTQQKQLGALLQQMEALEQRLTGLEQAAQRNELQPPQAGAVQNDVNALQLQVDAATKAPTAVLDRMSSLHRRTDDLLEKISARPAEVIAAVRSSR